MDKGIRSFSDRAFMEVLPRRAELGNRLFRKTVREMIKEAFGVTDNSASTHYNHSFLEAKKVVAAGGEAGEAMKLALGDLGRAEGKNNGGRKPKAATPAVTPSALLENMMKAVVQVNAPKAEDETAQAEEPSAEQIAAVTTETEGQFTFPTADSVETAQAEELQAALDMSALEAAAEVANPEQAAQDAIVPVETPKKGKRSKKVEQAA